MGTISASINVTPDGFCNHDDVIADDEFARIGARTAADADRLLLGRNTYELFEPYWPRAARDESLPPAQRDLGKAIDGTPRTVVSRSMEVSHWAGTDILRDFDAASAGRLAEQEDVLVFGSPSIIRQLGEWDVLDRLWIFVHPMLSGSGVRLFEPGLASAPGLNLKELSGLASGVQIFEFGR